MNFFPRHHACIALLAACCSTNALSHDAIWTPFGVQNGYEEADGYFSGPGAVLAQFDTCAIKMTWLGNEELSVKPSRASIRLSYIYSPEGYAGTYGLGCYTGKDLEKIRAD